MEPQHQIKKPAKQVSPMVWLGVIAGILIIGFFVGIQSLKSSNKTGSTDASQSSSLGGGQMIGGSAGGGGGGTCANGQPKTMMMLNGQQVESCGMPTNGTVTSVGTNTVTITDSSGAAKTFTVNDQTKIILQGGNGTLADVKTGDTLNVIPNEDDATVANYIMVNLQQNTTAP